MSWLLTVRQVALRCDISERTVWADIARGRLPVRRLGIRAVRIPASALNSYRPGRARRELMTIRQLYEFLGRQRSLGSLKRDLQSGRIPVVRINARCVYVNRSDARRAYKVLLLALAHVRRQEARKQRRASEWSAAMAERERIERAWLGAADDEWQRLKGAPMKFSVRELAAFVGLPLRKVYYDIEKGVVRTFQGAPRAGIRIPKKAALEYDRLLRSFNTAKNF
jgi:excisionase family DNA binding protein